MVDIVIKETKSFLRKLIIMLHLAITVLIPLLLLFPPAPPAFGNQSPTYMIAAFMAIGLWGFWFSFYEKPKK